MCIICLKPEGVDLPSDDEIKYMFEHNPHGAGFALQGDIHGDGRFLVEYHKGFMNVDDLLEALGPREKLKNLTVAIHCRIKTSGETDKFTTHPFPISSQYSDLRELNGSGAVLFHNGIFTGLGGIVDKNSSDTQDFVIGVANRYLRNAKMPGAISQAIVGKIAGECRILIMYPKKTFPLLKIGTWHEHKGCWYSNTGYKDESRTYYNGYSGYYADHYHKKTKSTNVRTEIDCWGCNVAEYAWPSMEDTWIRFTEERWESLKKAVQSKEEKNGETFVKFAASGYKEWIMDDDYMEIYMPIMRERVQLRRDEEDYLAQKEADGDVYKEEDYMWFDGQDAFLEWADNAERLDDYVFKFDNKTWYVNTETMEAYTFAGLKKYYPSGEVGHVKRQLEKEGFYLERPESKAKHYGFPSEDDDDDATPLLGGLNKYADDISEEMEVLGYGRS